MGETALVGWWVVPVRSGREALARAQADVDATNAAMGVQRMKRDHEYRKRYGMYLRGEIDASALMQGETHAQWWQRMKDTAREAQR